MIKSFCLCSKKKASFKTFIEYKNETVFKNYEGIKIGKCKKCGLLKTFHTKKVLFNPKESRSNIYESKKSFFINLLKPIVKKIQQYKKSGKVIDVGCSSGILLELLKKQGFDIYGIEPNKNAFNVAKKKFGEKIFFGTLREFYGSKILHSNQKKFEVIIYNHVLEHIEDLHTEFFFVKKILKNNGILVIGLPNNDNIIFYLRKKFWESLMPLEHIWHFSKIYFSNFLVKKGFIIKNISFSDDKRLDYPFAKKVYFTFLSFINKIINTGEAMLIIAQKSQ